MFMQMSNKPIYHTSCGITQHQTDLYFQTIITWKEVRRASGELSKSGNSFCSYYNISMGVSLPYPFKTKKIMSRPLT